MGLPLWKTSIVTTLSRMERSPRKVSWNSFPRTVFYPETNNICNTSSAQTSRRLGVARGDPVNLGLFFLLV